MIFSYNLLQSFFKQKLPAPEKLIDLVNKHIFEVENLEKKGSDWAITIDILPNRGDCLSHIGLARELSAVLGYVLNIPLSKIKENPKILARNILKVKLQDKDCLRYTARVVKNIKVGESDKKIKEYLQTCGLNSINNIVDAANFVMIEMGQPLHVFDLDKINQKTILVKSLNKTEKFLALDQMVYELNPGDMIIASPDQTLALAGIKGGKIAEINSNTKDIAIESADFLYSRIRKTSQKINLKTDASIRFEHKLDTELTEQAINRFVSLINGDVAKGIIDIYPKKPSPKVVKLETKKIESLLGIFVPQKDVLRILKSLGMIIIKSSRDVLFVKIPSFRLDIELQEELIEEIGRIYGYDKIPLSIPSAPIISGNIDDEILWADRAKKSLSAVGFFEMMNYSFVSQKNKDDLELQDSDLIEILNPLSSEYQYLRPNLLINLFKNVRMNSPYYPEIKIFEIGNVFNKDQYRNSVYDVANLRISGIIASKEKKDLFFELKGIIDYLLHSFGITDFYYKDIDLKSIIWKRNALAKIEIEGEDIGYIGIPGQKILDKFFIQCSDIAIFDIDLTKLCKFATEENEYQEISKYPAVVRDISIMVPSDTKIDDVLQVINEASNELVKDVDLFDIYSNNGQKSLAFHIIYQSNDKTLSGQDIDPIQQKIIEVLSKNQNWKPRI